MIWAVALFILAGPAAADEADPCGAQDKQAMVGTHAPNLTAVSVGQKVRIVRPASRPPNETDLRRLNIELDANEVVIAVYCG
jgi:hypothetical protein